MLQQHQPSGDFWPETGGLRCAGNPDRRGAPLREDRHRLRVAFILDGSGAGGPCRDAAHEQRCANPKCRSNSTVTGSRLDEISSDDFIKGLERPVLFTHAVNAALGAGFDTFVDVGPTGTLARHAAEIALTDACDTASKTQTVSLLRKSVPGWAATHDGLGKLFERGLALNLMHLDGHLRGPVHLPAYPYQRKRLWIDRANAAAMDAPGAVAEMPAPGQTGFARLGVGRQPWIEAHRVFGKGSAPSGMLLDLLLAETAAGDGVLVLNDVLIEKPLENDIGRDRELRVIELNGKTVLETRDAVNGDLWKRHLSARADASDRQPSKWKTQVDLSELGARCPYQATPGQLAERLADSGMTYGPALGHDHRHWRRPSRTDRQLGRRQNSLS